MAAFRNIAVVKSPSLVLLCVCKKSFIDWKVAVSDLKHACPSSPWVSCHVNVLFFGLPTTYWGMILLRSSGYQFQRLKITCSAKSTKAQKPGTFRPCADEILLLDQSLQANKPMNELMRPQSASVKPTVCAGKLMWQSHSFHFASDLFKDLEMLNHEQWFNFHDNGGAFFFCWCIFKFTFLCLFVVFFFAGVLSSSRPWTLCQRGYGYKVLWYQP